MRETEFKTLIDKVFTSKMHENGWKGTYLNFRKIDKKHLIKMFGVHKNLKQSCFSCNLGLDFDVSLDFPKSIPKTLNNTNCLFLNTLTPLKVSDLSYDWMLSDDDDQNIQLIESLWQAMSTHGKTFYRNFENFPHPFLKIAPKEFENDQSVKLLDQYYVWDQIGFIRLLKNVNRMAGNSDIAKQFSELGISRVQKSIKTTAKVGKTENKYFEELLKSLEI